MQQDYQRPTRRHRFSPSPIKKDSRGGRDRKSDNTRKQENNENKENVSFEAVKRDCPLSSNKIVLSEIQVSREPFAVKSVDCSKIIADTTYESQHSNFDAQIQN